MFSLPKRYPTNLIYQNLQVYNFDVLFKLKVSHLMWKLIHQPSALNVKCHFNHLTSFISHDYFTRDKLLYNLNFERASYTTSSSFQLKLNWNKVPSHLKSIKCESTFKRTILQNLDEFGNFHS